MRRRSESDSTRLLGLFSSNIKVHHGTAVSGLPFINLEKGLIPNEVEPPRVSRRLQLLREWSHEQVEQVFT